MALVLDASAVVDLLLRNALGRQVREHITGARLLSVAHLDAEVFSALSRLHWDGGLRDDEVTRRIRLLSALPLERLPVTSEMLRRAWGMRHNVAARDALYAAAAIALDAPLLTTDQRLARAVPEMATALDFEAR